MSAERPYFVEQSFEAAIAYGIPSPRSNCLLQGYEFPVLHGPIPDVC
jgi:hypothetical protein